MRVGCYGDVLIGASFAFFKLGGAQKLAAALGIDLPPPHHASKRAEREPRATAVKSAGETAVKDVVDDLTAASTTTTTTTTTNSSSAGASSADSSRRPSIVVHPPTADAPRPSDLLAAAAPAVYSIETPAAVPAPAAAAAVAAAPEEGDWEIVSGDGKRSD